MCGTDPTSLGEDSEEFKQTGTSLYGKFEEFRLKLFNLKKCACLKCVIFMYFWGTWGRGKRMFSVSPKFTPVITGCCHHCLRGLSGGGSCSYSTPRSAAMSVRRPHGRSCLVDVIRHVTLYFPTAEDLRERARLLSPSASRHLHRCSSHRHWYFLLFSGGLAIRLTWLQPRACKC